MNSSKISLLQRLQTTEHHLQILRQNLSQSSVQSDQLLETIKQLSFIKSELRRVCQTLTQSSHHLGSVLNHEFLTPLTLVQGALQLLTVGKFDDCSGEVKFLLNVAFKQTNQLIAIVRELRVYQNMKSGQLSIIPQQCCAAELIKQAAQPIQINRKEVRVLLSVKPEFISVWADPNYTILVLSHLLSNAIKFSPTRSKVMLKARLTDSKITQSQLVLFQIKDRGIGMTSDQLEKIFDCFYQVDCSDSRSYNGLGLGLALSQQIVQLHGGQLWAESSLGGGSSFYFTLPVDPQALHWWVEIQTDNPLCTYYFGPFETAEEAQASQGGYLEDLRQEQAEIIIVEIKQCQPQELTIYKQTEI